MQSDKNNGLYEKATSTENLIERAGFNQRYASNDFNQWTKTLLDSLSFYSVLDVCCGTGNQLILYGERPGASLIAGIDISGKSIETARQRLQKMKVPGRVILKTTSMENMFLDKELSNIKFDLISCFYGLYYSRNPENIITEMTKHISHKGALLIVGPYGKNNASLFSILSQYFALPKLVKRSSATFMEDEVYPLLSKKFDVKKVTFLNKIHYPDADSVIAYWKASTFYLPEFEDKITKEFVVYFSHHKEFIIEKHVMAYIARRI